MLRSGWAWLRLLDLISNSNIGSLNTGRDGELVDAARNRELQKKCQVSVFEMYVGILEALNHTILKYDLDDCNCK